MKFLVKKYAGSLVRAAYLTRKGPWPKKISVLQAINMSIRKWETIVEFLEKNPEFKVEDGMAQHCGLCHVSNGGCCSCPIGIYNDDYVGCNNTPYSDYRHVLDTWTYNAAAALKTARRELAFLKRVKNHYRKSL